MIDEQWQSYRDKAIDFVEQGLVEPMTMIIMCLKWMSEDDAEKMLDANELSERFFEVEE
tara:strand:- start:229 stop:405 length:177 start_codon:yes stop_codon:yes gene_type:complete